MNTFISEYGRFIVGVVSMMFVLGVGTFLVTNFRKYSVIYIQAITGVEETSYESNESP